MVEAFDSRFIMVAQPRIDSKAKLEEVSLRVEFCYTVVNVIDGEAGLCIQIRNPWSEFNSDSPLLKQSEKIYTTLTQNIAASLISNEKTLLLPLEEFRELFESVVICKICDFYDYTVIPVRHVKNAFSAVKFTITKTTHGFITANQLDKIYFQNDPNYTYANMRMILVKSDGNLNYQFVASNITQGLKCNTIEVVLEPGRYVLLAFADWRDFVQDLKLTFYSDRFIEPLRIDTSNAWDLFENILAAEADMNSIDIRLKREGLDIASFTNEISAE